MSLYFSVVRVKHQKIWLLFLFCRVFVLLLYRGDRSVIHTKTLWGSRTTNARQSRSRNRAREMSRGRLLTSRYLLSNNMDHGRYFRQMHLCADFHVFGQFKTQSYIWDGHLNGPVASLVSHGCLCDWQEQSSLTIFNVVSDLVPCIPTWLFHFKSIFISCASRKL